MDSIHFEENQRFREIAFFILIWIIQLLFLWGLTQQLIFHKPWGERPASDNILIILNTGIGLINILMLSINLETEITERCIRFRFYPFHLKEKVIEWHDIKEARVIKYDGIKEYWGYGLRFCAGKGWCYTISGNDGLRLVLKNDKRILIGTHNAKEISHVIDELKARKILYTNN
jgi:hypothetical protein